MSWLQTTLVFLRTNVSLSNLIGLIGGICALLLFLMLPLPWNIRLPFYLVIFIWTLLRPRVALYLMPIAVPWGSLDTLNIASLNLNSADLLVIFLGFGWLLSFTLHPTFILAQPGKGIHHLGPRDREFTHAIRYLLLALLLLISAMLLSMRGAISLSSSLKEISKWLEFFVLVLIGSQYLRTRRQIWIIAILICLGGISQAFFGYLQAAFNLGPEAFIRDTSLRVYGTFGQPNPYAGYINMPLSIAAALMLLGSNWRTRIFTGCAAILLAGAEYLTQSRGGFIAITVALLFIVLVGIPRLRKSIALLALSGLGLIEIFLVGWIPTYVLNPVLKTLGLVQISFANPNTADYSTAERLAHWIAGIRMFFTHPLTGVGIGNYPDAYPQYFVTIFANSLGHAHNYYINIAAETGSIGLTAFLLFLMAMFVSGGSAYQAISKRYFQAREESTAALQRVQAPLGTRNKLSLLLHPGRARSYFQLRGQHALVSVRRNDRALAIGLLAALLSICVHNLVDDLYVHSMTNLIALLLIALIRLEGVTTKVGGNGG